MSAYVAVLLAKEIGFQEIIDIGSGDGRIAFCAKILNLESYSIEIDDMLVKLQNQLTTPLDFHPYCSDATTFDYSSLNLSNPVFFIGGLAQMGGIELASGVFEKIKSIPNLKNIGWVLAGTYSQKYPTDPKNEAGWGTLIDKNNLKSIQTISLPTAWTFHESEETPYIFAQSFD
jgi:predicted RNA methylase